MKKLIFIAMAMFTLVVSAQEKMVIKMKDGSTVPYVVNKIERVSFEGEDVTMTTGEATNVTESSATLNYSVSGANGSIVAGVLLSKNSTLDYNNCEKVLKGTSQNGGNSVVATDLESETTYYYRAFAIVEGDYYYGEVKSFVTLSGNIANNCRAYPDFAVTFTNGIAWDWIVEDNVYLTFVSVFKKSYYDSFSYDEDKVISEIISDNIPKEYATGAVTWFDGEWFTPQNEYVLCTISYDNTGKRGELVKYPFTTLTTNLPMAEISNLKANSQSGSSIWTWDITLRNNATSYYLYSSSSSSVFEDDDVFVAFMARYLIHIGSITDKYTWTSLQMPRSDSQVTICSWAVNAINQIGNYNIARATVSASSRAINVSDEQENVYGEKYSKHPRTANVNVSMFKDLSVIKVTGQ